jgi:hypothetical protein
MKEIGFVGKSHAILYVTAIKTEISLSCNVGVLILY